MKFDNTRIYTADIYSFEAKVDFEWSDCSVGSIQKGILKRKDAVVLKMGEKFVPIRLIENRLSYLGILMQSKKNAYDKRLLETDITIGVKEGSYVENVKPLFNYHGETSLKKLKEIDKENEKKNTRAGFEFVY